MRKFHLFTGILIILATMLYAVVAFSQNAVVPGKRVSAEANRLRYPARHTMQNPGPADSAGFAPEEKVKGFFNHTSMQEFHAGMTLRH